MNVKRGVGRILFAVALATIGGAAALPPPAMAGSMTWRVKSSYKYKVQVTFYSKTRRFEWPGHGQAYDLNNYDTHEYTLACREGEKVCLGGWVTGNARRYWGVGYRAQHGCASCCYFCDGSEIPRQVLN